MRARSLLAVLIAVPLAGCINSNTGQLSLPRRSLLANRDNVVSAVYEVDEGRVWAITKETLAHLSERQVSAEEGTRTAVATDVDEGVVEVRVETLGPGRSRLLVGARLFSSRSKELARQVLDQIDRQIDPRRPDY